METVATAQPAPAPATPAPPGPSFPVPIKTGSVPVPKPAKLINQEKESESSPAALPKDWWSLDKLSDGGSIQGVIQAIESDPSIPGHWKTAIIADIRLRCGTEFNFVYVDGQYMVEKGNAVLHYHAVPDKKLL